MADIIIGFEPAEAVRNLHYLKPDGCVIVSENPVKPVTSMLKDTGYDGTEMIAYLKRHIKHLTIVDCESACREIGSMKAMNMVLLGAALRSGAIDLSMDDIKTSMRERVKPQYVEMNERALDYTA